MRFSAQSEREQRLCVTKICIASLIGRKQSARTLFSFASHSSKSSSSCTLISQCPCFFVSCAAKDPVAHISTWSHGRPLLTRHKWTPPWQSRSLNEQSTTYLWEKAHLPTMFMAAPYLTAFSAMNQWVYDSPMPCGHAICLTMQKVYGIRQEYDFELSLIASRRLPTLRLRSASVLHNRSGSKPTARDPKPHRPAIDQHTLHAQEPLHAAKGFRPLRALRLHLAFLALFWSALPQLLSAWS